MSGCSSVKVGRREVVNQHMSIPATTLLPMTRHHVLFDSLGCQWMTQSPRLTVLMFSTGLIGSRVCVGLIDSLHQAEPEQSACPLSPLTDALRAAHSIGSASGVFSARRGAVRPRPSSTRNNGRLAISQSQANQLPGNNRPCLLYIS